MPWWPFSSQEKEKNTFSEAFSSVPPPPSGYLCPPPEPPAGIKGKKLEPFAGFSLPPPIHPSVEQDYSGDSLKKYTSQFREASGINDYKYAEINDDDSLVNRLVTNPRARNCIENIKVGLKMGAAVGGIFGALTGTYAAIVHRSPLLLPLSIIGGGLSFGFFVGCGAMVRCDTPSVKFNEL